MAKRVSSCIRHPSAERTTQPPGRKPSPPGRSPAAGEAPSEVKGPWQRPPVAGEPAVKAGPVAGEGAIASEGPIEGVDDPRTRWMNTTYIELVVDGQIVDLNRIRLPGDTPIVDERFSAGRGTEQRDEAATSHSGGKPAEGRTNAPTRPNRSRAHCRKLVDHQR